DWSSDVCSSDLYVNVSAAASCSGSAAPVSSDDSAEPQAASTANNSKSTNNNPNFFKFFFSFGRERSINNDNHFQLDSGLILLLCSCIVNKLTEDNFDRLVVFCHLHQL